MWFRLLRAEVCLCCCCVNSSLAQDGLFNFFLVGACIKGSEEHELMQVVLGFEVWGLGFGVWGLGCLFVFTHLNPDVFADDCCLRLVAVARSCVGVR